MCRAQLRAHLTPREWGGALSPSADPRRFRLEAIALAERASGRRLRVNRMALDEIKAQRATAADPLQASFLGILEHLALGDEIPNAWGKVLGVRPVHMAEWFERAFGNVSRNG